jgi:protein-S-isoprenylcysteine O-methyltransferase Ste14
MKERRGEHPFGDEGQLIALGIFAVVWIADSFFLHWTTFLAASVPNTARNGFLYVALLFVAILFLNGRVVIRGPQRPDHVVDVGVFHYVRHPLYLAALLAYLGTAVSSFSIASLLLVIPIFLFYNYLATYEEKLLESKLGKAYLLYEGKTGKWLPGIGKKSPAPLEN